jgi:uncharacterized membrane protein
MNSTQTQTTIAPLVGFLAGLLAGKGVFGLDSATWTTIIGSLGGAAMAIWAAITTRKSALISSTAALPEVKSVKLEESAPRDLVAATPDNVTK